MARYIDADIALEKMKIWHTRERLIDCVRNTPTADVQEVRHGKWIGYPSITISKRRRTIQSIIYKCSCCGKSNGRAEPLYCKNCGALMDGKEADPKATEKWNKRIYEEEK